MNWTKTAGFGLALFGLLAMSGCGASAGTPPATLPVQGKVTYKGQPLTGGSIDFEPDGAGREAHARIKNDGTFTLSTYSENDGAVPGLHRVAVTGSAKGVRSLPAKYRGFASSGIEVEVTKDKTDYPITLE
jgi:hypothetical protein